jgi:hypothetical protein
MSLPVSVEAQAQQGATVGCGFRFNPLGSPTPIGVTRSRRRAPGRDKQRRSIKPESRSAATERRISAPVCHGTGWESLFLINRSSGRTAETMRNETKQYR